MRAVGILLTSLCMTASALVAAPAVPDAAGGDVPYATIIARNMFALVPLPTNNPDDDKPPADPPPKITPNGIMTIFGREQALFKVAAKTKPGQPAKEDAYVLAEGERQDDIEVVKINTKDSIITFNNHGSIQELPLVASKDTGGPSGPGGGPSLGGGNAGSRPGMSPADRLAMLRARQAEHAPVPNIPNNPNTPATPSPTPSGFNGNIGGGNVGGNGQPTPPQANEADTMTPEQQAFLIETQRKVYEQQGNPLSNLLPPTRGDAKQLLQQLDPQQ